MPSSKRSKTSALPASKNALAAPTTSRPKTRKTPPKPILYAAHPTLLEALPLWLRALKPRRRQSLSAWSRQHARLSDGSRYQAWPCQDGISDAFTEPGVDQITVRKSSRIGYSQIVQNYTGYCIDQQPTRLLIYQPTVQDAEDYSKDDLAPVLQWPVIRRRIIFKPRDPNNQIRTKRFPGGWIQIKGANSPKEFRRVTADKVLLEEPDGYPPAAGKEGDQVSLAFKRCLTSLEPLKAAGSTPTIDGASKIDALFHQGTQEYRYLPCPHCGLMQRLVWGGGGEGPGIKWHPPERPTRAWYRCEAGCEIDESHKPAMDRAGEWRATVPENWPHRSFHIWSAYSQFPGAAWLVLAREFLEVRHNPNRLMVFVNQVLAETWKVRGEAPAWRKLYDRREDWRPGAVPVGGLVLTAGIDVQKNRLEMFVWAWGPDLQGWLVDHQVIPGSPFEAHVWREASDAVRGSWVHENGQEMRLYRVGVDTGFVPRLPEQWSRLHPGLVIPVRGATNAAAPVFAWSDVREAGARGGKRKRGIRHGMVGGHSLTLDFYGLLALNPPTDEDQAEGVLHPPGFIHLNGLATEEVCKQLVGDEWVESRAEWRQVHATEALDGYKYARAVANAGGIDRWSPSTWRKLAQSYAARDPDPGVPTTEDAGAALPPPASPPPSRPARRVGRSNYLKGMGR